MSDMTLFTVNISILCHALLGNNVMSPSLLLPLDEESSNRPEEDERSSPGKKDTEVNKLREVNHERPYG